MLMDVEDLLDKAFKHCLVSGESAYPFTVRRKAGEADYYADLEVELKKHPFIKIVAYRTVKEGLVKVSRPCGFSISEADLMSLRPEYARVREHFQTAMGEKSFFDVRSFIQHSFRSCRRSAGILVDCLRVLNFLIENRETVGGLWSRQLPHAQSTKLVGQEVLLLEMFSFYRGVKASSWEEFYDYFSLQKRFSTYRIHAPRCSWRGVEIQDFQGLLAEDLKAAYDFSSLKGTLIIENLESFLPLVKSNQEMLLLWGAGWGVLGIQALATHLPQPIYYWGDLDKEGLEMASDLSQGLPLTPVLMDLPTLQRYASLVQKVDYGSALREVVLLKGVYLEVVQNNIRIEQEKIPFDWGLLAFTS